MTQTTIINSKMRVAKGKGAVKKLKYNGMIPAVVYGHNFAPQSVSLDTADINKIYKPGKFLNAALDKASSENEHCAITIKTPKNQIITSVQIAGLIARRILCYANEGSELKQGDRYGFIRFGSRVDHYIPINSKVKVKLGQKVKNSVDVLAEI